MATATLEIDQTILHALQAQASNQGLSLDALLRRIAENKNNEIALSYDTDLKVTPLTPYQIAKAKGLLGAVDSSVSNLDSPPIHTEFGQHLLEEYTKQLEELTKPN